MSKNSPKRSTLGNFPPIFIATSINFFKQQLSSCKIMKNRIPCRRQTAIVLKRAHKHENEKGMTNVKSSPQVPTKLIWKLTCPDHIYYFGHLLFLLLIEEVTTTTKRGPRKIWLPTTIGSPLPTTPSHKEDRPSGRKIIFARG